MISIDRALRGLRDLSDESTSLESWGLLDPSILEEIAKHKDLLKIASLRRTERNTESRRTSEKWWSPEI